MTKFDDLERELSVKFFGQAKDVTAMAREFEHLASMHRARRGADQASELEESRAVVLVCVADQLDAVANPKLNPKVRVALMEAVTMLVRAYQGTFPALEGSGVLVGPSRNGAGQVRRSKPGLSSDLIGLLVSVRAGLVTYRRFGFEVSCMRAEGDVTHEVMALMGLGLVEVPDAPSGLVGLTGKGVAELR